MKQSSMSRPARRVSAAAIVAIAAAALAGCAVEGEEAGPSASGDGAPIIVGIVTSTTGPYASQGESFINGFEGGLDYITDGTGIIDGHKIDVQISNDNGDPATGTAGARDLMGQGAKFLMGPTNSAVALPVSEIAVENGGTYIAGASGTSELLAKDHNVFVTGSGSWMPNEAIFAQAGDAEKIAFIGQDYQFGQDQAALLKTLGEERGIAVESVLLPSNTQDFTAGVLQLKELNADMVYVGWQGDGTAQLYQALADQGLYESTQIVTTLTSRPAIPGFLAAAGDNADSTLVLTSYFEGLGGGNDLEKAMIDYADSSDATVDYVHPQGFVAALMVQRAIEETGGELDQEGVAKALEGWSFDSPWGEIMIRPEDHLITVPMYSVNFHSEGEDITATLLETFPGADLAPAVTRSLP